MDERYRRQNAKRQAVAMMAHQGMYPGLQALADADLFVAGAITEKEFLVRSDARVAALPARKHGIRT